jgi:hypothetical protein
MLNMQAFHRMLFAEHRRHDPRLDTLVAITDANRDQLSVLCSELAWQSWGASTQQHS